jgi:hypothetical protein
MIPQNQDKVIPIPKHIILPLPGGFIKYLMNLAIIESAKWSGFNVYTENCFVEEIFPLSPEGTT